MMARTTQRPPIKPMSTQVKMLHRVSPSFKVADAVVEFAISKKSFSQLAVAVECFDAEMIIQVNETAKAAIVTMM